MAISITQSSLQPQEIRPFLLLVFSFCHCASHPGVWHRHLRSPARQQNISFHVQILCGLLWWFRALLCPQPHHCKGQQNCRNTLCTFAAVDMKEFVKNPGLGLKTTSHTNSALVVLGKLLDLISSH